MESRFVYITCANEAEAVKIGKALVQERLAACANILPGMISCYWWKGEVQEDRETVLVVKSRAALADALTEKVKALHSYEVPCVVFLPIVDGNPDYLKWLGEETGYPN